MEDVVGMLAVTGLFSSIILGIYLHFKTRHQERIALIQAGKDAGIFNQKDNTSKSLKHGIVAFCGGIGLLVGNLMESLFGLNDGLGVFSMLLIFCGAGLLVYYFIMKGKTDEDPSTQNHAQS